MLNYIIEVSFCWLGFYLIYALLLSRLTFFRLNRWYLFTTLILGLVIPMLEIPIYPPAEPEAFHPAYYLEPITVGIQTIEITVNEVTQSTAPGFKQLLWVLYLLGALTFAFRFLVGLLQIRRLYRGGTRSRKDNYTLVETEDRHLPFSFFQVLFKSTLLPLKEKEEEKIIEHELAHIEGGHSFDVMLLEILAILLWCSPIIYLYRESLRTVHEYLADAAVLRTTKRKQYGHLLLRQSQSGLQVALANNFIHSQLKKRFIMMTKKKSRQRVVYRYLLALPVLFFMTFLFSSHINVDDLFSGPEIHQTLYGGSNDNQAVNANASLGEVDEYPRFPGCEAEETVSAKNACSKKKLVEFMIANLKYPESAKEANTSGKVVVSFAIDTDGSVTDVEVVKSLGHGCDEAALNVVQKMPNWIPGKKDGKTVKVDMKLPFSFQPPGSSTDQKELVYKVVEQMPFFPGCEKIDGNFAEKVACSNEKLISFVSKNIKYPEQAKKNNVSGMVVVQFIIDKDGGLIEPKLNRSLEPSCDQEVMRVIQLMNETVGKWTPGYQKGKAVKVVLTLPVKFKMDQETEKGKVIEMLEVTDFNLSPVPSDGMVNLRFKAEEKPTEIRVTDLSGRQVYNKMLNNFDGFLNTQIDLNDAGKGMYFLSIVQGKKVYTEKLIIE